MFGAAIGWYRCVASLLLEGKTMNNSCRIARISLTACLIFGDAEIATWAGVSFTNMIQTGAPLPDGPGTISTLGLAVLDDASTDGSVLVGLSASSFEGLYLTTVSNTLVRVVSTETPKPGGGTFSGLASSTAAVHGGVVYWLGQDGIYRVNSPGDAVTLVAQPGDIATGTNTFLSFSSLALADEGLVFGCSIKGGPFGSYGAIYHYAGGTFTEVMGYNTVIPDGGAGKFSDNTVTTPVISEGEVSFRSSNISKNGFYVLPSPGSGKPGRVVADNATTIPGSAAVFSFSSGNYPGDQDTGDTAHPYLETQRVSCSISPHL
jgi:hypothetical protein